MSEAQASVSTLRQPPRRDSLSERIYLDLRDRLQRCEIDPDSRLVDIELAAQHGASRMPAREALLRLANEGYLQGTTRGFVVARLSPDDIREIFEVRRLLEPRAAACAARDLTPVAEAELTRALREAAAAAEENDVARMILANIAFRNAWLSCVRNERLASAIARFVDHAQTVRLSTLRAERVRAIALDGLKDLHDAFVRRDAIAASDGMEAFMIAAERAFFASREADAESAAAPGARTSAA